MTELTSPPRPLVGSDETIRTGVFDRIGWLAVRRSRGVLLVSMLVFLVGAGVGATAFGQLKTGGFTDPNSGSARATRQLDDRFGGAGDVVLLVHSSAGTVDDPAVAGVGNQAAARLAAVPGVTHVESYWPTHDRALRSTDGHYALVVGTQRSDTTISARRWRRSGCIRRRSTSASAATRASATTSPPNVGKSLALAEAIAVPIVLLLLVFAFGSFVSASAAASHRRRRDHGHVRRAGHPRLGHRRGHLRDQPDHGDGDGPRNRLRAVDGEPFPRGADRRRHA